VKIVHPFWRPRGAAPINVDESLSNAKWSVLAKNVGQIGNRACAQGEGKWSGNSSGAPDAVR
jgi:hypothetical protein